MRRFLWLSVLLLSYQPRALGCASCGSGGDDPLILYPNEVDKVYLGLSRATNFKNVDPDGGTSTAGGATTKDTLTFAYGHAFSTRSFATATLPYLRNIRQGQTKSSPGDPSVAGRYTLVMASIAEPLIPQVQVVAGYKQSRTHSIHDSADLTTQLDVFGTGFSEVKAGLDVWLGQNAVMGGAAVNFIKPLGRRYDGVKYEPGTATRSTVTVGYAFTSEFRTTAGANLETRAALQADGVKQKDSEQTNHSVFFTQDWMPTPLDDFRLSLSRQSAFGENKNTARSDSISFAYIRSF